MFLCNGPRKLVELEVTVRESLFEKPGARVVDKLDEQVASLSALVPVWVLQKVEEYQLVQMSKAESEARKQALALERAKAKLDTVEAHQKKEEAAALKAITQSHAGEVEGATHDEKSKPKPKPRRRRPPRRPRRRRRQRRSRESGSSPGGGRGWRRRSCCTCPKVRRSYSRSRPYHPRGRRRAGDLLAGRPHPRQSEPAQTTCGSPSPGPTHCACPW